MKECLQNVKTVMRCAIWYHLYNLKNVKNTHGGTTVLKVTPKSRTASREIVILDPFYTTVPLFWYFPVLRTHIA